MIDPMVFPALLSLSIQGIIGIISQVQHSRCSEINCWGCNCKRNVPQEQEPINNQVVARPINNLD